MEGRATLHPVASRIGSRTEMRLEARNAGVECADGGAGLGKRSSTSLTLRNDAGDGMAEYGAGASIGVIVESAPTVGIKMGNGRPPIRPLAM